jgi:hypothetical protein
VFDEVERSLRITREEFADPESRVRVSGAPRRVDKPFPEANLLYGHADKTRGLLYLLDRTRPCLVVWDVADDRGEVFAYPEAGSLPSIRETGWPERLEVFPVPAPFVEEVNKAPGDTGGPSRRVYFDPDARRFVAEDNELIPPLRPGTEKESERYIVTYQDGRVVRLNRQTGERYERPVPGWEEVFGFIAPGREGGVFYRGWKLTNLSTYQSSSPGFHYDVRTGKYTPLKEDPYLGVDGQPYHFLDRFLAYHPETDQFDMLVPDVPEGRYPQLCYTRVVGDELYITANNIWSAEKGRPLGGNEKQIGQLMVLQSHPLKT